MMTFRKISAACRGQIISNYYLQDIPDPESDCRLDPTKTPDSDGARLTNYYTGRDGRASWRPDMPWRAAEALGIDRFKPPSREQLSRLYEAKRADNGEEWSAHQRKISAYDLTLAPHKSVTLAAEFAETDAERAAIWHAMQVANDETMRYVARELGLARRGRGQVYLRSLEERCSICHLCHLPIKPDCDSTLRNAATKWRLSAER